MLDILEFPSDWKVVRLAVVSELRADMIPETSRPNAASVGNEPCEVDVSQSNFRYHGCEHHDLYLKRKGTVYIKP